MPRPRVYNLFEATTVVGAPETVLVWGQVVIEDERLVAEPGVGAFVARSAIDGLAGT
ncbi:MAG TPA: hypothetical protein VF257_01040 [Solirubrobacteraceae bacterium]